MVRCAKPPLTYSRHFRCFCTSSILGGGVRVGTIVGTFPHFPAHFTFGFRSGVEMIVKTRTMRWPVLAVIRFALSRDLRRIGGVLMKKWFVFIVCLWAFPAFAQGTYTATSCSLSAVSAAIAAEQAHPVDGDIISIPAGSCSWSSGLTQAFNN